MTINNTNVDDLLARVKIQLSEEKDLSPALRASLDLLLVVVTIILNRLGLNSSNSSKPPSADPNRAKKPRVKSNRKPGGQLGHVGATLQPVDNPDKIKTITIDRRKLPHGHYQEVGYESRQVVDIDITQVVTEWRAQILEDSQGKRYVAPFPDGVTRPVQYGIGVKANSVYMSQFQLV